MDELTDYFGDLQQNHPESEWLSTPFEHTILDEDGNEAETVLVSFAEIKSTDEIRRDPRKVLAAPQWWDAVCHRLADGEPITRIEYNWRPGYLADRIEDAELAQADGRVVVWIGCPEKWKPPIGLTHAEWATEHDRLPVVRERLEERIKNRIDRGDFRFLPQPNRGIYSRMREIVSNEAREETPSEDGTFPPADPMDVANRVLRLFRGGLKQIQGDLCVVEQSGKSILNLDTAERLFAFLYRWVDVQWNANRRYLGKREALELVRQIAPVYRQFEYFPHFPRIPEHVYLCQFPTGTGGEAVDGFLDFFCFATDADRHLYHALLATLIWGGPAGMRPAWAVTAPAGRGVGKTTLAAKAAEIFGGSIDVSLTEDEDIIKQRLLSPDSQTMRVVLCDNLKSYRASSAAFEALITAPRISGKRLYHGEAQRPNFLNWILTVNAASLSKDLAQRVITIELDEPQRTGDWEECVSRYIADHREEIIGDLLAFYRRPACRLARHTRWATWESEVLCRFLDAEEMQRLIRHRQQAADVENEEASVIEDHLRRCLGDLNYDIDHERIFLPSAIATQWLNEALNERLSTVGASRKLGQLISEGTMNRLARNKTNAWGKGFVWNGEHCDYGESIVTDIEERQDRRRTDRTTRRTDGF